jgi:hypothetical protein
MVSWEQFSRHATLGQEELLYFVSRGTVPKEGRVCLLLAKQLPEEMSTARNTLAKLWEEVCAEHVVLCENPSVCVITVDEERFKDFIRSKEPLRPFYFNSLFEPGISVEFFPYYDGDDTTKQEPAAYIVFLHT